MVLKIPLIKLNVLKPKENQNYANLNNTKNIFLSKLFKV